MKTHDSHNGYIIAIAFAICMILYKIAFHNAREENKILKEKLSKYEKTY